MLYKYMLSGALILCHSPVLAQDVAPAGVQAADRATVEDDIVVTARRREETLQNVPVAITAFSQKSLEQKAITSPFDLARAVPGLTVAGDQGAPQPIFSIRGRGQFYGAAAGSVETYFADVPLSAPFGVPNLPVQFFDLQSVQVLKGPQGTLFGRNSTGGAILFVPAAPTDDFGGYARVQVGTHRNLQFEGAVNIPLNDWAKLRVSGFHWNRQGYTRTVGGQTDYRGQVLPSQRVDNQDVTQMRATLLLEPSDNLTNSTIFTYHTDQNRSSSQLIALRGPNGAIPVTGVTASPRIFDTAVNLRRPPSNIYAIVNTTSLDITPNLKLKNIFSYINAEGYYLSPAETDGSALVVIDSLLPARPLRNRQLTNEVQLQGSAFDGFLDFTVGGLIDLTRQPGANNKINIHVVTAGLTPLGTVNVNQIFRQSRFTSKSFFGSATFHLADSFSVTAGARRAYDSIQERTFEANSPTQLVDVPAGSNYDILRSKFRGWSYNASAEWRPTDASMIYGGYRRGYKRGGFNAKPPTPASALFGPETVDDFYLGLKQNLEPLGVRGHFNIEGFYDIYHGAQRSFLTLVGSNLAIVVDNAEKSTYRGFDTDFVVEPAEWIQLSGNYTFVDAKYNKWTDTSFPPFTGDLSVNPPGLVSKHKFSLTPRLHMELKDGSEIAFAPTVNYQSKFYFTDNSVLQPNSVNILFNGGVPLNFAADGVNFAKAYATVDLRMEWNKISGSNVNLAVNATNLTNKIFRTGGAGIYAFGFESGQYGAPRMISAEVRVNF